jgi:hypothetical protein
VQMQVEDRLSRCRPEVHADVVAGRAVHELDSRASIFDGREEFKALGIRCIKPGGDMPDRNQECVAWANREAVPQAVDKGPPKEDPLGFRSTERARRMVQDGRTSATVMVNRPSRPAPTQAAQRQREKGRRASRRM